MLKLIALGLLLLVVAAEASKHVQDSGGSLSVESIDVGSRSLEAEAEGRKKPELNQSRENGGCSPKKGKHKSKSRGRPRKHLDSKKKQKKRKTRRKNNHGNRKKHRAEARHRVAYRQFA